MNLLILGGTLFLGRHCAQQALARGWRVSLFHRGETGSDLFEDAEHLFGDRSGGLAALGTGTWDAVIDCSGKQPSDVVDSEAELSGRCGQYTYVSSISAYLDLGSETSDETHELRPPGDDGYASRKVGCELAAAQFDGPVCIVRPGLIVGPYDPTERFAYWVRRAHEGGRMLCPGSPDQPVQVIDAADLARWMLDGASSHRTGTYNAVSPTITFGELLDAIGGSAERVWVPSDFLVDQGVEIWTDLPLWLTEDMYGFERASPQRALGAGLKLRPLIATAAATLKWCRDHPVQGETENGISREREAHLLAEWSAD